MMKKLLYLILCIVATLGFTACREAYNPQVVSTANNYLVVEGFINISDSTKVKISRTVNLTDVALKAELKAVVTVEDDQNKTYPLTELANGSYAMANPGFSTTRKYRLRIKTNDGETYVSDLEQPKVSPPIDEVAYTLNNSSDGIILNVTTHDATGNSRYYRWDYEETWRFNAKYNSLYRSNGVKMVTRLPSEQVYSCFGNAVSSNVLIGNSTKLSQDVMSKQPLALIASSSEKLSIRYSVLVKQYAITKDAYTFWEAMMKNTEQLGGIFDPQPSQINGNIHCTSNPSLPVIGYISAGTVQSKRIFIDRKDLPQVWATKYPYDCGPLDTVKYRNNRGEDEVTPILIRFADRFTAVDPFGQGPDGFLFSSRACADCTLRGTTKQPAFWQ